MWRVAGTGSGPNAFNESETVAKFEIMDGATARPAHVLSLALRLRLALDCTLHVAPSSQEPHSTRRLLTVARRTSPRRVYPDPTLPQRVSLRDEGG